MDSNRFRYEFQALVGFFLNAHLIAFRNPLGIWDTATDETVKFDSMDDFLAYMVDGVSVRQLIDGFDRLPLPGLDGGRGAGDGTNKTFKFSHADGGGGKDNTRALPPAAANVRIKSKTPESAMAEFRRKHGDSDHEWAYEIDDQGFVHQYVEGNRSSVAIYAKSRSTMILHNHPSGGAFSDSDLITVAMQPRAKGIVATSKKAQYTFTKGTHFKADAFVRAVKNATLRGKDYDDAADKWLTKNQRKYGYKYKREK